MGKMLHKDNPLRALQKFRMTELPYPAIHQESRGDLPPRNDLHILHAKANIQFL